MQLRKFIALLCASVCANAIVAMDGQSKTTPDQKQQVRNPITTLKGIVARNATGNLECKVTYNAITKIYAGTLINNHYSMAEWYSQELDAAEAQQYYQQLSQATAGE